MLNCQELWGVAWLFSWIGEAWGCLYVWPWLLAKKWQVGFMMCCLVSESPLVTPNQDLLLMVFTWLIWLDSWFRLCDQKGKGKDLVGTSALSCPAAEIQCTRVFSSSICRQSKSLWEQRPWAPLLAWACARLWGLGSPFKWIFKGTNKNNPNFILWRNFNNYMFILFYLQNILDRCLLVYKLHQGQK